jgi:hypothetical protein
MVIMSAVTLSPAATSRVVATYFHVRVCLIASTLPVWIFL